MNNFDDFIESILGCERTFDDLVLSSAMGVENIRLISEKFGRNVKSMFIQDILHGFNDMQFHDVLINTPKMETLTIKAQSDMPKCGAVLQPLSLPKLKQVKTGRASNASFLSIIEACNLEEFYCNGYKDVEGIAAFIAKQTSIKKLQLSVAVSLDALKLTHFKFIHVPFVEIRDADWEMMFRSQQLLKVLDIDDRTIISDRCFNFIRVNMKQLKVLKINVSSLISESIVRIRGLLFLKELKVANISQELIEHLANPAVERLTISVHGHLTEEDLIAINGNFPSVNIFNIKMNDQEVEVKLKDFVDALKKLEVLRICFPSRHAFDSFKTWISNDDEDEVVEFPKLKVLQIYFTDAEAEKTFDGADLKKLIESLPNLINLKLQMSFNIEYDIFKLISEHQKMQHFNIESASVASSDGLSLKKVAENFKTIGVEVRCVGINEDEMKQAIEGIKNVTATSYEDNSVHILKTSVEASTVMDSFDFDKEIANISFNFESVSLV